MATTRTWLLFFLESHGAHVTLSADRRVRVNFDRTPGLDAATVERWAPVITNVLPEMHDMLQARRHSAQP